MGKIIQPRTLKGFRDQLPASMIPRERLIDTAREVYRSFGFVPIDTPALEYTEILLGKGSDESDKQMYRFEDPGGRDVSMRFDLTIPLARFVAQHVGTWGPHSSAIRLVRFGGGKTPSGVATASSPSAISTRSAPKAPSPMRKRSW